ncbi:hypothetical protein [Spirulina sp. 06S082]|uniref:hypothetical protein n=1 Tax=Spirulina sp. 06S082 TaxID=3110248 RepID=UPI002B20C686|nr:hypothetical protein [Spirulina sp. 06S082]MEA5467650.1 hypothetical protein [Spirulina sp. 06S082]
MNFSLDNDPKIKKLQEDMEQLNQDYEGISQDARNALDSVIRGRLEKQAEKIYDEWKLKKADLEELREKLNLTRSQETNNKNIIYVESQTKLLNFDYKQALQRFSKTIEKIHCREGGARFFVIEKCLSNGGKYCSKKLIHYLQQTITKGKFFEKKIQSIPGEQQNKQEFLRRLAGELHLDINSEFLERDIIQKIHSLFAKDDSGLAHFFHFSGYKILAKDKTFWNWFIDSFWTQLITSLPNHPYLKLIFLFELDVEIPKDISVQYICTSFAEASPNKIVKLPLKRCQMKEIENWLYNDSDFSRSVCEQILQTIEEETERKPNLVYEKFLELLNQ